MKTIAVFVVLISFAFGQTRVHDELKMISILQCQLQYYSTILNKIEINLMTGKYNQPASRTVLDTRMLSGVRSYIKSIRDGLSWMHDMRKNFKDIDQTAWWVDETRRYTYFMSHHFEHFRDKASRIDKNAILIMSATWDAYYADIMFEIIKAEHDRRDLPPKYHIMVQKSMCRHRGE